MSRNKILTRICIAFAILCLGIGYFLSNYLIIINVTESLPNFAFIVHKGQKPQYYGQIIAFKVNPKNYYGEVNFIKKLAGLPNDVVTVQNRFFYINGKFIAYAKEKAKNNRVLALGASGKIPAHKYFLFSEHPDSYDSRYEDIGLVDDDSIIGTATPIL